MKKKRKYCRNHEDMVKLTNVCENHTELLMTKGEQFLTFPDGRNKKVGNHLLLTIPDCFDEEDSEEAGYLLSPYLYDANNRGITLIFSLLQAQQLAYQILDMANDYPYNPKERGIDNLISKMTDTANRMKANAEEEFRRTEEWLKGK